MSRLGLRSRPRHRATPRSLARRHPRSVLAAGAALVALTLSGVPISTSASAVAVSDMKFGFSAPKRSGETAAEAVDRQVNTYGRGVVRLYSPGTPMSWSSIVNQVGDLPVVVSFKMSPKATAAGQYDSTLRSWFKNAPRDRTIWWSYMPEPEDDIMRGEYSAATFRSAYARVAGIADEADNARLKSTLTLMCYTLKKSSGRDWRDYWPGSAAVDVLAWDCANKQWMNGEYAEPANMLGDQVALARQLGKGWGMGEFEGRLVSGDNGTRRAAWLVDMARYMKNNGAAFGCYYDANNGVDFRLLDSPSKSAWRSVVVDQTP